MIGTILAWITGGGLSSITKSLERAYQAKLTAQTDEAKLEADIRISELEAKRSVLIAEQGSWATRWIRPAIAAPFVIYVWKLVFFDKVLGWGSTDGLSPELWKLFWIVIGAYFITRPVEKLMRR